MGVAALTDTVSGNGGSGDVDVRSTDEVVAAAVVVVVVVMGWAATGGAEAARPWVPGDPSTCPSGETVSLRSVVRVVDDEAAEDAVKEEEDVGR